MSKDSRDFRYRKCSGRYFVREHGYIEFSLAYFHEWGTDSEEVEGGVLNYTIGIVELKNGKIVTVMPENIKFVDMN